MIDLIKDGRFRTDAARWAVVVAVLLLGWGFVGSAFATPALESVLEDHFDDRAGEGEAKGEGEEGEGEEEGDENSDDGSTRERGHGVPASAGDCSVEATFALTPYGRGRNYRDGDPYHPLGRGGRVRDDGTRFEITKKFETFDPEAELTTDGKWAVKVRFLVAEDGPGRATIAIVHQGGPGGETRSTPEVAGPAQITAWARALPPVMISPPAIPAGEPFVVTELRATATWQVTATGDTCSATYSVLLRWNSRASPGAIPAWGGLIGNTRERSLVSKGSLPPPDDTLADDELVTFPVTTFHGVDSWESCCGVDGCSYETVQFVRHTYELKRRSGKPKRPKARFKDAWSLDISEPETARARAHRGVDDYPPYEVDHSSRRRVKVSTGVAEKPGDDGSFRTSAAAGRWCPAAAPPPGPFCGSLSITPEDGTYDPTFTNHPRGAGDPDEPEYVQPGPDPRGRPAIVQRDRPGMDGATYRIFSERRGVFRWHFWNLLVCEQDPSDADHSLSSVVVKQWIRYTIELKFKGGRIESRVKDQEISDADDDCGRLLEILCAYDSEGDHATEEGSLVDGYLHPRPHQVVIPAQVR